VLYRPRFKTNTIFLWLSPFIFLMIGMIVVYKVVRKKIIT
jgi:cytochrome c-type biogenesis protein CcmH/NrfF